MQLGTIQTLDPKTLGLHEEHQFTPWLMANLDRLGEALGIDIDLDGRQREVPVGRYTVDITAREAVTGRAIIIENQLRPSDHSHLGQLLTYAAGTQGSVIVWVCHVLRDEHRQVLDWLNSHVPAVHFFGVEFDLLRIDDSAPAFRFTTVVRPPEWEEAGDPAANPTARYRAFFQPLIDTLRNTHQFTAVRKAQEQSWASFATGSNGLSYSAAFSARTGVFRIELYIQTKSARINKAIYDALEAQKVEIEQRLETGLSWDRGDGKQYARMSVAMPGNVDDLEKQAAMQAWGTAWLLKFKKVFGGRLPSIIAEVRDRLEDEDV